VTAGRSSLEAWLAASTAASNVPRHVQDEGVLLQAAGMVAAILQPEEGRDRAAASSA
jgi:hypothetical protein